MTIPKKRCCSYSLGVELAHSKETWCLGKKMENHEHVREIEELRAKLEKLIAQHGFGLQRFAGSDEDIRFYTRYSNDLLLSSITIVNYLLLIIIIIPKSILPLRTCSLLFKTRLAYLSISRHIECISSLHSFSDAPRALLQIRIGS